MKSYTVHEPPEPTVNLIDKADRIIFVREGFSWLALTVPAFWLIYHRMWLVLGLFVGLVIALQLLAYSFGMSEEGAGLLSLFTNLVAGFEGNNLRRWTLERKGYHLVGSVRGKSREESEYKFFTNWMKNEQHTANLGKIAARTMSTA